MTRWTVLSKIIHDRFTARKENDFRNRLHAPPRVTKRVHVTITARSNEYANNEHATGHSQFCSGRTVPGVDFQVWKRTKGLSGCVESRPATNRPSVIRDSAESLLACAYLRHDFDATRGVTSTLVRRYKIDLATGYSWSLNVPERKEFLKVPTATVLVYC